MPTQHYRVLWTKAQPGPYGHTLNGAGIDHNSYAIVTASQQTHEFGGLYTQKNIYMNEAWPIVVGNVTCKDFDRVEFTLWWPQWQNAINVWTDITIFDPKDIVQGNFGPYQGATGHW